LHLYFPSDSQIIFKFSDAYDPFGAGQPTNTDGDDFMGGGDQVFNFNT